MLKDAFLLIVIQIHVQFLMFLEIHKAENAEAMPDGATIEQFMGALGSKNGYTPGGTWGT